MTPTNKSDSATMGSCAGCSIEHSVEVSTHGPILGRREIRQGVAIYPFNSLQERGETFREGNHKILSRVRRLPLAVNYLNSPLFEVYPISGNAALRESTSKVHQNLKSDSHPRAIFVISKGSPSCLNIRVSQFLFNGSRLQLNAGQRNNISVQKLSTDSLTQQEREELDFHPSGIMRGAATLSPIQVKAGVFILDLAGMSNLELLEKSPNGGPNIAIAENGTGILVMAPDVLGNPVNEVLTDDPTDAFLLFGTFQCLLIGANGGSWIISPKFQAFISPLACLQVTVAEGPVRRLLSFNEKCHSKEETATCCHIKQVAKGGKIILNSVKSGERRPNTSLPLHHRAIYLSINQRFSQLCHMAATWLGGVMRSFQAETTQFRPLTQPENGATGSYH